MSGPEIDVEAARRATPGCEESVFLLSAGSSLPTQQTLDAAVDHLQLESRIGGYAAADQVREVLQDCRADLGALVGGQADEVALVPSDSVAWVKAWWGWVLGGNVRGGSVVLIDRLTYHSHYAALAQTQTIGGFEIREMPSLPDGTVDVSALKISAEVSVICATMIGTHCGNVNPIAEIGALAAVSDVPLFVDGCQALGQLALDVEQLGCHVFTGTGRKFLRAPRGTGMLWVTSSLIGQFQPFGLDAANADWVADDGVLTRPGIGRFEEFEAGYAGLVGLAAAARQALELGMDPVESRVTNLAEHLRVELAAVAGVTVRDTAARRCGIVTFTLAGVAPTVVVEAAASSGITISSSTATWAALDMAAKGIDEVVRVSPHYFNTEAELDELLRVVRRLTG